MPMKTENKTNHYIDLHAHLDGCITVDIAKKLAALQQITLPAATDEELLSLLSVPDTCENLNDFLKCFDLPLSLLQTEEALEEAVYLILSEMRKDGVIYAELRFAPQFHTQKGMTQETAIQSALRGLKKSPIPGNLILCCMRGSSNQQENMETLDLARRYLTEDGGVVAVDLAGAEALFPTESYKNHFKILNNSTTDSVNALKEGKVDLAVVSATLQVTPPLKMKIVKKYRDILIGGNRFEKLKNRELCGENCA